MKKCLIPGGAGFLGSHLCERLLKEGNEVICLDNLFTGSRKNILHLLDNKNFTFIGHDVTIPYKLQVDQIYNLACPASPVHYQHDPVKTIRTAVFGAINMLDLAKETGARILQASTSEVYGNPSVHPQNEEYWGNVNPVGIRACYDEGKRCAETLFMDYYRQYGVDIRIARIFNTYGPRMRPDDGRVVSNFIVQALKNEPITIYGYGLQTRSFQYVDDLIDGLIALMDSDYHVPVNLGNTNEYSIGELAKSIIELTGSKSEIKYMNLPSDDPARRKPDISLAQKILNWTPKTELSKGLKITIAYFQCL